MLFWAKSLKKQKKKNKGITVFVIACIRKLSEGYVFSRVSLAIGGSYPRMQWNTPFIRTPPPTNQMNHAMGKGKWAVGL